MKGNPELIDKLNGLLARELTAINQYFVEAEMYENWDLAKLSKEERMRAITEMKHAEKLIERIIFLEGHPIVNKLEEIRIGADAPNIIRNDLELEYDAVRRYNEAIEVAQKAADNSTKTLLEGILNDEIDHVDQLEAFQDQIAQMGLPNFLTTKANGEEG